MSILIVQDAPYVKSVYSVHVQLYVGAWCSVDIDGTADCSMSPSRPGVRFMRRVYDVHPLRVRGRSGVTRRCRPGARAREQAKLSGCDTPKTVSETEHNGDARNAKTASATAGRVLNYATIENGPFCANRSGCPDRSPAHCPTPCSIVYTCRWTASLCRAGARNEVTGGQYRVIAVVEYTAYVLRSATAATPLAEKRNKTQCNSQTEVCCRIDASVSGFGQASSSGSAFLSSSTGSASQGAFVNSGSTGSGSKFGQSSFGGSQSGSLSASSTNGVSGSNAFGANSQSGSSSFGIASKVNSAFESSSASYENRGSGIGGSAFGSTLAPSFSLSNSRFGVKGSSGSSQGNFISSDSSSAGSDTASVYRPGAPGTINKPGIPYLPPVDSSTAQNFISSTAIPPPTVPYVPPRPSTTPRPVFTPPTYLPPVSSTSAPGYLPPIPAQTIQTETRVTPGPVYIDGSTYLDETRTTVRPTQPFIPNEIPAGCAAALKCTPIEYCTAEGVMSSTPVILSKDQESYRVPLTDCKDPDSGVSGKCCRDPNYSDPWPANLIGKWAPGVFGGNDGKYTPDNAGSPNNPRPQVTARPYVTGSTILPVVRKNISLTGPNQVTPGFGPTPISTIQKGQYEVQGTGQYEQKGEGRITVGGEGKYAIRGQGQVQVQGEGGLNEFGQVQGQKRFGQAVIQGGGQIVSQGFGTGIRQGQGFAISQGSGYSIEEEYALESRLFRVLLQRYGGSGECGVLNGQKPYGDKNELEVDFAEIPWQAMVLLQTNRSLLCGGVITRPDVVVTSASCVEGLLAKNVLIKGGEWKLAIDDEPLPFQIVQVKHILRHPEYRSGSFQNDVAILVLTENLRLAKNIWPICLPGARDTFDAFYNGNGECIVTGWGKQVLQVHTVGQKPLNAPAPLMSAADVAVQRNKYTFRNYENLPQHWIESELVVKRTAKEHYQSGARCSRHRAPLRRGSGVIPSWSPWDYDVCRVGCGLTFISSYLDTDTTGEDRQRKCSRREGACDHLEKNKAGQRKYSTDEHGGLRKSNADQIGDKQTSAKFETPNKFGYIQSVNVNRLKGQWLLRERCSLCLPFWLIAQLHPHAHNVKDLRPERLTLKYKDRGKMHLSGGRNLTKPLTMRPAPAARRLGRGPRTTTSILPDLYTIRNERSHRFDPTTPRTGAGYQRTSTTSPRLIDDASIAMLERTPRLRKGRAGDGAARECRVVQCLIGLLMCMNIVWPEAPPGAARGRASAGPVRVLDGDSRRSVELTAPQV
ncbi:Inactive serine protease scarface [Eumeta japonica]|uniref:Inactive serine protease scarface n=1 Tax=Eumeta variegata TaxID=151549 RepID=A0A4C1U322_EUMVA|nr:Inactive serine protease scarface [Eumeta japonica]